MTKEERDLVWRDLVARIPYGVKVKDTYYTSLEPTTPWLVDHILQEVRLYADENWQSIEHIKPYLRPMSSMTEEEDRCFRDVSNHSHYGLPCEQYAGSIDWLNSHHFDYRRLIEKGLALEAPEGMYKL